MQKGREGLACLLGLRGFGDADGRPWQTDVSQSKVIVRSNLAGVLLENKCKAILFSIGDNSWSILNLMVTADLCCTKYHTPEGIGMIATSVLQEHVFKHLTSRSGIACIVHVHTVRSGTFLLDGDSCCCNCKWQNFWISIQGQRVGTCTQEISPGQPVRMSKIPAEKIKISQEQNLGR